MVVVVHAWLTLSLTPLAGVKRLCGSGWTAWRGREGG
jgi:hypothetical protein